MREGEKWREKRSTGGHERWSGPATVGRRQGGRWESKPSTSGGQITHYFFSNFPENFTEKALWTIFQRYNRVWEVFIAPRRNKAGRKFGFVRFLDVKDPWKLEKELDTILIGSMKMHVNLPRFDKRSKARLQLRSVYHGGRNVPCATVGNKVIHGRRTFAQVLQSQPAKTTVGHGDRDAVAKRVSGIQVSGCEESPEVWGGPIVLQGAEWLERSFVGVLKDLAVASSIQTAGLMEGLHYIQVRHLGDGKVLLTGPEGFDLGEALKELTEGPEAVFNDLYKWSPKLVMESRITWVRCAGFPLHMWTRECFAEVLRPVGELISVDGSTTEMAVLEFARLQIRTSLLNVVTMTRKLCVNGVVYSIRFVEECCGSRTVACQCLNRNSEEDGEESGNGWSLSDESQGLARSFAGVDLGGGGGSPPTTIVMGEGQDALNTEEALNVSVEASNDFPRNIGNENFDIGTVGGIDGGMIVNDDGAHDCAKVDCVGMGAMLSKGPINYDFAMEVVEEVRELGDNVDKVNAPMGPMMSGTFENAAIANSFNSTPVGQVAINSVVGPASVCGAVLMQTQEPVVEITDPVLNVITHVRDSMEVTGGYQNFGKISLAHDSGTMVEMEGRLKGRGEVSGRQASCCPSASAPAGHCQSAAEIRKRVRGLCFSLTSSAPDSHIASPTWLHGVALEAKRMWEMGKEFGVSYEGEEEEVIRKLLELAQRDVTGSRPGGNGGVHEVFP